MKLDKKDKITVLIILIIVAIISSVYKNKINDREKIQLVSEEISSYESNNQKENNDKKEDMKVHITGEINNPGVYQIKQGDRLVDLVEKAGGLTQKADESKINLAMRLDDEMKIIIPNVDDNSSNKETFDNVVINAYSDNDTGKVNINTADITKLQTLPNIGEKRAKAIIDYRQNTKFEKIEDIKNVTGIGDKYFEALKDQITVK
ncbi:MAG: DUF655 domain-containing protein [Tissierellia bacterium]|nr:DUF655 domain-containing protein [Tissierellia bacterium]